MNVLEMSEVVEYIQSLEDSHIKELLNNMSFEYGLYQEVGTVEECKDYKRYCRMSVSDVLQMMWKLNEVLKVENECQKQYYEKKLKELQDGRRKKK